MARPGRKPGSSSTGRKRGRPPLNNRFRETHETTSSNLQQSPTRGIGASFSSSTYLGVGGLGRGGEGIYTNGSASPPTDSANNHNSGNSLSGLNNDDDARAVRLRKSGNPRRTPGDDTPGIVFQLEPTFTSVSVKGRILRVVKAAFGNHTHGSRQRPSRINRAALSTSKLPICPTVTPASSPRPTPARTTFPSSARSTPSAYSTYLPDLVASSNRSTPVQSPGPVSTNVSSSSEDYQGAGYEAVALENGEIVRSPTGVVSVFFQVFGKSRERVIF